jgi:hypothetical protein
MYRPRGAMKTSSKVAKKKPSETPTMIRLGVAVTLKGSQAWKDRLERFAHRSRLDVAKLFDRALAHYAASEGFTEESPRR